MSLQDKMVDSGKQEMDNSPCREEDGTVSGVAVTAKDLAFLKQSEESHNASEAKFRAVHRICHKDNGIGLPPDLNARESDTLGFRIIHAVVEHQLNGRVSFSSENGLTCDIQFPDPSGNQTKGSSV